MAHLDIRLTRSGDIPGLQQVVTQTGLFPAEMLPGLVGGFLRGTPSEIWLTALQEATPVGFCYALPEPMTEGTWNMRALAVQPDAQGSGVGRALVAELEDRLRQSGARVLIVDTSGQAGFAPARAFYTACGYDPEARIRDFWAAGDDKVTFWKALAP
ncbi:MAG: GNAT family N-acetyltransferase [Pseudomonadota bacterium]